MSDTNKQQEDFEETQPNSRPNDKKGDIELNSATGEHISFDKPEPNLVEEPSTEAEQLKIDFQTSFQMGLAINGIAACFYIFLLGMASFEAGIIEWDIVWMLGSIWLLVNILILAFLAFRHRIIFQGAVAGLALAFFMVFVVGVFFTYYCFGGI